MVIKLEVHQNISYHYPIPILNKELVYIIKCIVIFNNINFTLNYSSGSKYIVDSMYIFKFISNFNK